MGRGLVAWAVAVALAGGGCWQDATSAEQRASVERTLTPADRAVAAAVGRRAVVVVSAPGLALVGGEAVSGRSFALRCRPGAAVTCGCAAVVDGRGYLATAAHLVGPDPILIVGGDRRGVTVRPARVVYRGDDAFDFALLYVAPAALPAPFAWASAEALTAGTKLVGVGTLVKDVDPAVAFRLELFAGRLVRVDAESGPDGPFAGVVASLPGHHGDSGGPQFTAAGDLVGVTTAGGYAPLGRQWRSYAVRPDLDWLRRTINADQRLLAATR